MTNNDFFVNTIGDCQDLPKRTTEYLIKYDQALRSSVDIQELETIRHIIEGCGRLADIRSKQVLRKYLVEFINFAENNTEPAFEAMSIVGKLDREIRHLNHLLSANK